MLNNPVPPIDFAAIENFIGYGVIDAPVVFIGIEEKLSEVDRPQRLAGLAVRSHFQPIMDVQEAHAAGLPQVEGLFDARNPLSQPTWRPMCELLLRLAPGVLPNNAQGRIQYQLNWLGRAHGSSLLAELFPLPHGSINSWWYNDVYPALHTRAQYEEFMLPRRTALLAQQLALFPRDLIVCYGRSHVQAFSALIAQYRTELGLGAGHLEWQRVPLVNQETGREWSVQRTVIGQTDVVMANHFTRMPLSAFWAIEQLTHALGY